MILAETTQWPDAVAISVFMLCMAWVLTTAIKH